MGRCKTRTGRELVRINGMKRVADISVLTGKPLAGPGATWDDPQYAIRLSATLGLVNQNEISLGLSYANLSDLKCLRNYVIHSNSHTGMNYARMIRNHGMTGVSPDQFIRQQERTGPTVFESWVENLLNSAWNAVT